MNKQIKKSISLFLLALVLTTQVGLHFLHHHSASHSSSDQATLHADHDQHCAVCGLDLFIAQELPVEFSFSFPLQHEEKWVAPALSAVDRYTVFTSGRAPPLC